MTTESSTTSTRSTCWLLLGSARGALSGLIDTPPGGLEAGPRRAPPRTAGGPPGNRSGLWCPANLTTGDTLTTRQPWSERVSAVESAVVGSLMVVTARSAGPVGDWWQAYLTREAVVLAAQF
jgi:hypothetical protein